jgi:hypothetical protein
VHTSVRGLDIADTNGERFSLAADIDVERVYIASRMLQAHFTCIASSGVLTLGRPTVLYLILRCKTCP